MIALLDGNCFYVSCQVAFDPGLRGRPVVVLSCNDGAVIARSNEARALGIKMSQPWFQIRHMERSAGLVGLSAQFALYGDMSDRLMTLAAKMGSASETAIMILGLDRTGAAAAWAVAHKELGCGGEHGIHARIPCRPLQILRWAIHVHRPVGMDFVGNGSPACQPLASA